MIILAGVVINLTLGDSGIFNKAKYAKEEYLNAKDKEETDIAKINDDIDLYINGTREMHNYSTDEHSVGTWIDGSTIYEKTFNFNNNLPTNTGEINLVDLSSYNIKEVINVYIIFKNSNDWHTSQDIYFNGSYSKSIYYRETTKALRYSQSNNDLQKLYVIMQYTTND